MIDKIYEKDLPEGYYRIGNIVYNKDGEQKGFWITEDNNVKFENCYIVGDSNDR